MSHAPCLLRLESVLRRGSPEPVKEVNIYLELPSLACLVCAKVSNENIVATCALCDCLEDRSACFVVPFNVASDHISWSAASQQMTAEIF